MDVQFLAVFFILVACVAFIVLRFVRMRRRMKSGDSLCDGCGKDCRLKNIKGAQGADIQRKNVKKD